MGKQNIHYQNNTLGYWEPVYSTFKTEIPEQLQPLSSAVNSGELKYKHVLSLLNEILQVLSD